MTFLLTYSILSSDFSVWFDLPSWSKWEDVRLLLPREYGLVTAQRSSVGHGSADPIGLGGLCALSEMLGQLLVTVPGVDFTKQTLLLVGSLGIYLT